MTYNTTFNQMILSIYHEATTEEEFAVAEALQDCPALKEEYHAMREMSLWLDRVAYCPKKSTLHFLQQYSSLENIDA